MDENVIFPEEEKVIFMNQLGCARVIDSVMFILTNPNSRVVLGDKLLLELRSACLDYFKSK